MVSTRRSKRNLEIDTTISRKRLKKNAVPTATKKQEDADTTATKKQVKGSVPAKSRTDSDETKEPNTESPKKQDTIQTGGNVPVSAIATGKSFAVSAIATADSPTISEASTESDKEDKEDGKGVQDNVKEKVCSTVLIHDSNISNSEVYINGEKEFRFTLNKCHDDNKFDATVNFISRHELSIDEQSAIENKFRVSFLFYFFSSFVVNKIFFVT